MSHKDEPIYSYIEIKSLEKGEVVKRIDVTKQTDRSRATIEMGMNRNLNHNEYYTFSLDSLEKLAEI